MFMGLPRKVERDSVLAAAETHKKSAADTVKDLRIAYAARTHSRVHPLCKRIWRNGRRAGRRDTFIGLIDTTTWTYFLAPCFGVDYSKIAPASPLTDLPERFRYGEVSQKRGTIGLGLFPYDTACVSTATSAKDAEVIRATKRELDEAYKRKLPAGFNPVVFVGLGEPGGAATSFGSGAAGPSFDGKSHQGMSTWVNLFKEELGVADPGVFWKNALGFAVQRDNDGYYVRYSSALNVEKGQPTNNLYSRDPAEWTRQHQAGELTTATFQKRTDEGAAGAGGKEIRDLPKEWARLIETVLARDLKLAVLRPEGGGFERITSRGESKESKLTRFEPAARSGHRDRKHRGTHGTDAVIV